MVSSRFYIEFLYFITGSSPVGYSPVIYRIFIYLKRDPNLIFYTIPKKRKKKKPKKKKEKKNPQKINIPRSHTEHLSDPSTGI